MFRLLAALIFVLCCSATMAADAHTIGFVGVGTMNSAIVRGLCTLETKPKAIVLSPRNAEKAAALQAEFPGLVTIAPDNQAVIDASDVVFIGVLPKLCEEVCKALKFKSTHIVCSLVSTAPLALLRESCAGVPLEQVVRAIPLPPVAKHQGATIMCPPHAMITPLFESLGTCVAVEEEDAMKKMMPVTALMGQFYAQQLATQQWLEAQGVEASAAAKWTGAVFHCVSYDSAKPSPVTLQHLVDEQTPGGLNEQVVREMREAGAYTALSDSLDGCLARVMGVPASKKRKHPYSSTEE